MATLSFGVGPAVERDNVRTSLRAAVTAIRLQLQRQLFINRMLLPSAPLAAHTCRSHAALASLAPAPPRLRRGLFADPALLQEGHIDQLDEDAPILHGLDAGGDLNQLASGVFRVGQGASRSVFHGSDRYIESPYLTNQMRAPAFDMKLLRLVLAS